MVAAAPAVYNVDSVRAKIVRGTRVRVETDPGTDNVTVTFHAELEDALSLYDPFFNLKPLAQIARGESK